MLLGSCALIGLPLAWIDARTRRLPDAYLIVLGAATAGVLLHQTLANAHWTQLALAVALGALYALPFFLGALMGQSGLGDAKLALLLGAATGYQSFACWLIAMAAAFLTAFPHAVIERIRRGKQVSIPFGPYMILGTVVALTLNIIVDW